MFTGLIERKGFVTSYELLDNSCRLTVSADYSQLQAGESIAVNGVCLTLLDSPLRYLCFDVSSETLRCTNFAHIVVGASVNLERAMSASSRFGGHYVSGHVDKVARVCSIQALNEFVFLELDEFNHQDMFYLIPKGSITVNGVSLTINDVIHNKVQLMLVPHTLLSTNLQDLQCGAYVNIEFDYLTRIVAHQLQIAGTLNKEVKP